MMHAVFHPQGTRLRLVPLQPRPNGKGEIEGRGVEHRQVAKGSHEPSCRSKHWLKTCLRPQVHFETKRAQASSVEISPAIVSVFNTLVENPGIRIGILKSLAERIGIQYRRLLVQENIDSVGRRRRCIHRGDALQDWIAPKNDWTALHQIRESEGPPRRQPLGKRYAQAVKLPLARDTQNDMAGIRGI